MYAAPVEIRTEIEISAPPSRVWDTLLDFRAYPDWNPMLVRISGKAEVGAKLTVVISGPGGREFTIRPKVLVLREADEFRWKGQLFIPGLVDGNHFFRLIDLGDGRTRFIHGEDFSGILVRLVTPMFTDVARGFVYMNQALKRRVEGQPGSPARSS
jgi:hypothetical protein